MADSKTGMLNKRYVGEIRKGFEYRCIFNLIDGYTLMKEAGEYEPAWEEESLTANLIKFMKHSPYSQRWKLDIIPEHPVYADEVYAGVVKPKAAPVIDVRIMNWSTAEKLEYFIEAKNLAANDWTKPDGATVSASSLRTRYIDTGIDNFIEERYPWGCLAGYVLEGRVDHIVEGINKLLESGRRNRAQEMLTQNEPINGHPDCYLSEHQTGNGVSRLLNHIFLSFSR